jgi:MOSC domain-containing protein YiiM
MNELKLIAISVGKAVPLFVRETTGNVGQVVSAIKKSAVSDLTQPNWIEARTLGLVGDEVADPTVHGGIDKAIYMMPFEHYAFWNTQRKNLNSDAPDVEFGGLGENLTCTGLLESEIFIGDNIRLGDVLLSVTQAREPCFKFNARMGYKFASKHMIQQGNCGWYLKVLKPGQLQAGMSFEVIEGPRRISIQAEFSKLNARQQKSLF